MRAPSPGQPWRARGSRRRDARQDLRRHARRRRAPRSPRRAPTSSGSTSGRSRSATSSADARAGDRRRSCARAASREARRRVRRSRTPTRCIAIVARRRPRRRSSSTATRTASVQPRSLGGGRPVWKALAVASTERPRRTRRLAGRGAPARRADARARWRGRGLRLARSRAMPGAIPAAATRARRRPRRPTTSLPRSRRSGRGPSTWRAGRAAPGIKDARSSRRSSPRFVKEPPRDHCPRSAPARPGRFGQFGGQYVAETLMPAIAELEAAWRAARADAAFWAEVDTLLADYVGRPSRLYHAQRLSSERRRARSTSSARTSTTPARTRSTTASARRCSRGAWASARLIAETGAGQHGVATATVAALFGLPCEIYMGAEDVVRQALNVLRMKLLGAAGPSRSRAGRARSRTR